MLTCLILSFSYSIFLKTNFIDRNNLKCNPDTTDYTYEVYYRPTYETRAQNVSVWRSERSVTISNLQQCTVYSISVRIRNAVGRKSEATEPTSIRTNSEGKFTMLNFTYLYDKRIVL